MRCEATLRLVIGNKSKQKRMVDAVIDTGYTGFLSLPSDIISALDLPWTGVDRGTLGDGSETTFQVYAATVIWDGEYRAIPINAAEVDPLIGMGLLYGYDLRIQAKEGGLVTVQILN